MSKSRPRLRNILILLGVLVCLGVPAYSELFLKRPEGSGPAGPSAAFAEVWTDRPVLLLGIGDSITRELGAKSTDHSFFQRQLINPPDEWDDMSGVCLSAVLPNLASENLSVSGSTSLDHADVIANRLTDYPEELFGLVVMTTGGNDLIHSYGRRPPVEGAMYGVGDAASIFLPGWTDGLAIHAWYNVAIKQVASQYPHVHVVPLHQAFLSRSAQLFGWNQPLELNENGGRIQKCEAPFGPFRFLTPGPLSVVWPPFRRDHVLPKKICRPA